MSALLEYVDEERLLEAKRSAEEMLLVEVAAQAALAESGSRGHGFENIVGVAVGERYLSDRPTGESAITVYVVEKVDLDRVDSLAVVPPRIEGIRTDVVETGEFVAASARGRFRPAPTGVSVAHYASTAGTLGFFARRDDEMFLCSNNHVLARENEAELGDAILQPGPVDGGQPQDDTLAHLATFLPLSFDGDRTMVDAALARLHVADAEIDEASGLVPEALDATSGMVVRKNGRTSGLTRGYVRDLEATVKVRYRNGMVLLADQFTVKGLDGVVFSEPGDSGSLVVSEQARQPVGMLCGGSPRYTLVTPLQRVLNGLGVTFVG